MLLALAVTFCVNSPLSAQSYRVTVRHVESHSFQAVSSGVIIDTRSCGDLALAEQPEEAILNWEGRFGDNWLLFTRSRVKCDVVGVR